MKLISAALIVLTLAGCATTQTPTEAEAIQTFMTNEHSKQIESLEARIKKLEEFCVLVGTKAKLDLDMRKLNGGVVDEGQ